jgi:hypothetical protein
MKIQNGEPLYSIIFMCLYHSNTFCQDDHRVVKLSPEKCVGVNGRSHYKNNSVQFFYTPSTFRYFFFLKTLTTCIQSIQFGN